MTAEDRAGEDLLVLLVEAARKDAKENPVGQGELFVAVLTESGTVTIAHSKLPTGLVADDLAAIMQHVESGHLAIVDQPEPGVLHFKVTPLGFASAEEQLPYYG